MQGLTTIGSSTAGSLTGLGVLLGTVGVAVVLLSTNFRNFSASIISSLVTQRLQQVSLTTLRGGMLSLTAQTLAASAAFRTFAAATGIGLLITGLTVGLGFLVNKLSEAKQADEEFAQYLEQNNLALSSNKEEVDKLLVSLDALRTAKQDNGTLSTEDEEELVNVQNRLAELYPALIDHIDTAGNASIKSSEGIQQQVEATQRLVQAERELARAEAEDNFDSLKDNLDDIIDKREAYERLLASKTKTGADEQDLAEIRYQIAQLDYEYANSSQEIQANILDIAAAWQDAGTDIDKVITNDVQASLNKLDFSNLSESQLSSFSKSLSPIIEDLNKAYNDADEASFDKANAEFIKLLDSFGLVPDNVNVAINSIDNLSGSLSTVANTTLPTDLFDEYGSGADEVSKKVADLIDELTDYKNVQEQLVGVTEASLDSSRDNLFLYEQLTAQIGNVSDAELQQVLNKQQANQALTSSEQILAQNLAKRGEVLSYLTVLYPQLATLEKNQLSLSADQINAAKQEEAANRTLLESANLVAQGKYTSEQYQTFVSAAGAKARIQNIQTELKALEQAYNQYIKAQNEGFGAQGQLLGVYQQQGIVYRAQQYAAFKVDTDTLTSSIGSLSSYNTQLASSTTKSASATKSASDTSKSANTTTNQSIYVTDEYAQAIEKLNTQIEKQQALRAEYSDYSATYRKSLESEIKLQQQQLKLTQAQATALEKQIASGKIKQTGNVTVSTGGTTSTTTTSTGKVTGNSVQDQIYNFFAGKGLSNNAIAGILGNIQQESGFNASAVNSIGATGLFQYLGSRKTALQAYAKSIGTSVYDVQTQLEFAYKELQSTESKAYAALKNTSLSAAEQASEFDRLFERSGRSAVASRQKYATAFASKYASASTGTTSTVSSTSSGEYVDSSSSAIDDAKSALQSLYTDIYQQQAAIAELQQDIIDSQLAYFQNRQDILNAEFDYQDSRLTGLDRRNALFDKIQDTQLTNLERRQKAYEDELAYNRSLLTSGNLTNAQLDETNKRIVELQTNINNVSQEATDFALTRIIDDFNAILEYSNELLTVEQSKLSILNTQSELYRATLENTVSAYRDQRDETEKYIETLQNQIRYEQLSGDALKNATTELNNARAALVSLESQISTGNYEIFLNINNNFAEVEDDLQFQIDLERELRNRYEEGSKAYNDSIAKEINLTKQQASSKKRLYDQSSAELEQLELTSSEYKAGTEVLEDVELQYQALITSVQNLNKELTDSKSTKLSEIADDYIDAVKDYYSERQDESNKYYDNEAKKAQENHDKILKQYEDEISAYRKNAQEKLDLLDRSEATRSYENEIDDLLSQREELDNQINRLALDNSKEGRKRAQTLQSQLDDIDKDIAEKRHDRDVELQRQSINDNITAKEEEIQTREDLENEAYDAQIKVIDEEKEYWDQYYTDLLNDQRKFNDLRERILNGHLNEVQSEFEGYALQLESTIGELENTLNGQFEAVGTAIRQNIIDNLRDAIQLADDYNSSQTTEGSGVGGTTVTDVSANNPNVAKPFREDNEELVEEVAQTYTVADYKVLLAKYLKEYSSQIAKTNSTKNNLYAKANALAAEGRNQGSVIPANEGLNSALANISTQGRLGFKDFASNNIGNYITSDYLIDDVKRFAASLDTGGFLNFGSSTGGIDGKGGKALIAHDGEVIFNKMDTKSLFNSIDVASSLTSGLASISSAFNNIFANSNSSFSNNDELNPIVVQFGDVYGATQTQADNFSRNIISKVRSLGGSI